MGLMKSEQAIGVFDSGVGGLSVLAHIHTLLANENLCYVADSAYMPYGCKPESMVEERSLKVTQFLAERPCKAIVVACNTATAAAIHKLRGMYDMPVIGMEPALKPAVGSSPAGLVGVLATSGTISSDKFKQLKLRYAKDAELIVQPCPGLVEEIEKGELGSERMLSLLGFYLKPLLECGVDTLVLGCTHYPFISPLIRRLVGESVTILDAGDAIARELYRQLELRSLLSLREEQGSLHFWKSGDGSADLFSRLWGKKVSVDQLDF